MSTTLWLTLTVGSATNATDVIEIEEMIQVERTLIGYEVGRYDGLLPVVHGNNLANAVLNYLKRRIEAKE